MLSSVNRTTAIMALPRTLVGHPRMSMPVKHFCPTISFSAVPSRKSIRHAEFLCEAEAQSSDHSPGSTNIVDYALGQGAYHLFIAMTVALNLAIFAIAPKVSNAVFGVTAIPHMEMLYRTGASMFTLATFIAYCMQSAVAANRLDSPTYKRLAFALALSLIGVCSFRLYIISQGFVMPGISTSISSFMQLLPTVAFLKLYGTSTLSDIIPGVLSGITSVFQPDNLNAAIYSLLTVVTMLYAVITIPSPDTTASMMLVAAVDPFAKFLIRSIGCAMFLVSVACFTLKDAADRGRLGFSTFRTLNIGLCLISVVKICNILYVARSAAAAAASAATTTAVAKGAVVETTAVLTKFGWYATFAVFGTLALVSGYNAITAKKN